MSGTPSRKRCAIYTRKSTEEGLEQSFNSLDAQREACEAYVLSQAGEGWVCLPELYDDGGWSGGNMDRPALARLLEHIRQGRIDIVVVYKVDRLTRSLMDFARIVETFDSNDVSFVSVTQAFNTTNSMGRLTLNVLLSFAQFEREVTGERIRDKIAASRARGMWMGGMVPLGYDLGDRRLEVNDAEAETVRHIFRRYLALGSLTALAKELRQQGVRSKRWVSRAGKTLGGCVMSLGALSHILNNRVYRGEAVHRGKVHRGEHDAIIDEDLFEGVQARLEQNRVARRTRKTRAASSPLVGKIHDSDGQPMSVSFSYGRGKVMYRYYVSECLTVAGKLKWEGHNREGLRLPAARTEKALVHLLRPLHPHDTSGEALLDAISKVTVTGAQLLVEMEGAKLMAEHGSPELLLARARAIDAQAAFAGPTLRLTVSARLPRKGRLIASPDAQMMSDENGGPLADLVHTAHKRLGEMHALPHRPDDHRIMSAPASAWIRERVVFGVLAPDIQKAMLTGGLPPSVTAEWMQAQDWPLDWAAQRALLECNQSG